jgi:hypothetical protein
MRSCHGEDLSRCGLERNTLIIDGEWTNYYFVRVGPKKVKWCKEKKGVWKTNSVDPRRTKSNLTK